MLNKDIKLTDLFWFCRRKLSSLYFHPLFMSRRFNLNFVCFLVFILSKVCITRLIYIAIGLLNRFLPKFLNCRVAKDPNQRILYFIAHANVSFFIHRVANCPDFVGTIPLFGILSRQNICLCRDNTVSRFSELENKSYLTLYKTS